MVALQRLGLQHKLSLTHTKKSKFNIFLIIYERGFSVLAGCWLFLSPCQKYKLDTQQHIPNIEIRHENFMANVVKKS